MLYFGNKFLLTFTKLKQQLLLLTVTEQLLQVLISLMQS